MSLTDPAPIARGPRPTPGPGTVVFGILLLAVAGFCLGFALTYLTQARDTSTPPEMIASMVIGMLAMILGNGFWWSRVIRRREMGLGYAAASTFLPAALGVWLSSEAYPAAPTTPIVLGLAGFGLLMLLAGFAGASARRRRERVEQVMMETGFETLATVSNRGYDSIEGPTLAVVTFTYRDHLGTQRWVQKPMRVTPRDAIEEGNATRLWFDPSHPDDASRIVVELAREKSFRS